MLNSHKEAPPARPIPKRGAMLACHPFVTNECSSYATQHAILSLPSEMEEPMRELRSESIGNRRVRLLANQAGRYTVTIEVRGPQGAWEDISLVADQDLELHTASLCYRLRLTEQQVRMIDWGND